MTRSQSFLLAASLAILVALSACAPEGPPDGGSESSTGSEDHHSHDRDSHDHDSQDHDSHDHDSHDHDSQDHDSQDHDPHDHDSQDHDSAAESWSVTAWGSNYEVFPEAGALVAGEATVFHTHVTVLDGFTPMSEGRVEIVISAPSGREVFGADRAEAPGVFNVELRPARAGEYDLAFRIDGPRGVEEIPSGRVRVGSDEGPGGLLVAPEPEAASDPGEPLEFLKEEQWRSDFATSWVRTGELARSVSGLARVTPPAGGEAAVTAPVDGVLRPVGGAGTWPFVGQRVDRQAPLFVAVPRVAADRSLPALEADVAAVAAELAPARSRLARLRELLALEAASRREVEEAEALVHVLEARQEAAARDLEAARSSRQGASATGLTLRAPIAGEIAAVSASPGATVAAGEVLARLVRTDLVWLEIALPAAAARAAAEGVTGIVLSDGESAPMRVDEGVRLVSVAPELSPRTGTVAVFVEVPAGAGLKLGATVQAQLLLRGTQEGIIVPASALVDDGGVPIVYLQLSGESFARQEVEVLDRQGELLRVGRLTPGQRLVTRGGESIRRSALMASGDTHGHVH